MLIQIVQVISDHISLHLVPRPFTFAFLVSLSSSPSLSLLRIVLPSFGHSRPILSHFPGTPPTLPHPPRCIEPTHALRNTHDRGRFLWYRIPQNKFSVPGTSNLKQRSGPQLTAHMNNVMESQELGYILHLYSRPCLDRIRLVKEPRFLYSTRQLSYLGINLALGRYGREVMNS